MFMFFIFVFDNWFIVFYFLFLGCSGNEKNCLEEEIGNNIEKKYGVKVIRESEVSVYIYYCE